MFWLNTATFTANLTFFYCVSHLPPQKKEPLKMSFCFLHFGIVLLAIVLILSLCSRGHLLGRVVMGEFLRAGSCLHLYFPTASGLEPCLDSAFHVCCMAGYRAHRTHLACRINATQLQCARCPIIGKGNHLSREERGIAVVSLAFLLSHSFLLLCPIVY